MRRMSMSEAILQLFKDNPNRIFTSQDVYLDIEDYYELSNFQRELDPKYPRPRYQHEIRSIIAKLEKKGIIKKIGRDQRRLV